MTTETPQITARLINWVYDPSFDVYWGLVYGDTKKRFEDGTYIHTSKVVKTEGNLVYTLNSVYELGPEAQ